MVFKDIYSVVFCHLFNNILSRWICQTLAEKINSFLREIPALRLEI